MKSTLLALALAMSAAAAPAPASHADGHLRHSHHKRQSYNLAGVDWSKIDWTKVDWSSLDWKNIFANKDAGALSSKPGVFVGGSAPAASPVAAAAAPAAASPSPVASPAAVSPVAAAAKPVVAAPAVSSPAAVPSTPVVPPTSGVSGGKRGVAWEPANGASGASLLAGGATSWWHNWGMSPNVAAFSSKAYAYTIRTLGELGAASSVPRGAYVLGFNEADIEGISPDQAASIYKSQLLPLRQSGQIGTLATPSITNGGSGLPWMQAFMAACGGGPACGIDVVNIHWYGPDFGMLQSQVGAVHAAFPNYPVVISEIAATNWNVATNPSAAGIAAFMAQATAWLDSQGWVQRYAWFKGGYIADDNLGIANSLLNQGLSQLTSLGSTYNA
ncbi:hypothetical protein PYCC9005_004310 [Savitreella phatthalungensis]